MSQAFLRFKKLQARIQEIKDASLAAGITMSHDQAVLQAGEYKSRGHGKGKMGKNYFTSKSPTHDLNGFPIVHSRKREVLRHQRQNLHMAVVNGFELMQLG